MYQIGSVVILLENTNKNDDTNSNIQNKVEKETKEENTKQENVLLKAGSIREKVIKSTILLVLAFAITNYIKIRKCKMIIKRVI